MQLDGFLAHGPQADLLSIIVSSSKDCIKIISSEGRLDEMSAPGLCAMEIDDFSTICGAPWESLWPEASQPLITEALERARSGLSSTFQAFCPTAKGTPKWWDVSITPVRGSDHEGLKILSVSRDITAQKTLEENLRASVAERDQQLAELAKELQRETERLSELRRQLSHAEKVRLLGDLVGHIVHDMNNVLAVLASSFRMVKRKATGLVPSEIFEHGEDAIDRGARMVRQLLDFARGGDDEPELIKLDEVVSSWQEMLGHLVGKAIEVKIVCPPGLPAIATRTSALQSVVFNLSANARDAMPEGGTLTLGLTLQPSQGGRDRVRLFIRDTGCGMTPEVLARAGEPFYTTKPVGKGTGLGLASAFEFARANGGSVELASTQGEGTTVSLLLPTAGVKGEIIATPEDIIDPGLHGDATLLVVEEDSALRTFVAATLRVLGYTVMEAHSPGMALGMALNLEKIDLVIGNAQLGLARLTAQVQQKDSRSIPLLEWADTDGQRLPDANVLTLPISEVALARTVLVEIGRLPGLRLSAQRVVPSERTRKRLTMPDAAAALDQWLAFVDTKRRLPAPHELAVWDMASPNRIHLALETFSTQTVFKYLDLGSALEQRLCEPLVGAQVTGGSDSGFGSLDQVYRQCRAGAPFFDYARYGLGNGQRVSFERLMLPFSLDGLRVTHLLGYAHFEETQASKGEQ